MTNTDTASVPTLRSTSELAALRFILEQGGVRKQLMYQWGNPLSQDKVRVADLVKRGLLAVDRYRGWDTLYVTAAGCNAVVEATRY